MKFYRPLGDRECTGDFFVCQTAHHLTVIGCWRNLSAQFDRDSTQRGRPVVSTKNRALIDECHAPRIQRCGRRSSPNFTAHSRFGLFNRFQTRSARYRFGQGLETVLTDLQ
jgi:hypothetical protein